VYFADPSRTLEQLEGLEILLRTSTEPAVVDAVEKFDEFGIFLCFLSCSGSRLGYTVHQFYRWITLGLSFEFPIDITIKLWDAFLSVCFITL
jgi:hypothetical protein